MWASSFQITALTLLLPLTALGAQVVFNLDIVNAELSPDGNTRNTVVANGTFPGPTIKVNKGDSVVIHTHNKLTAPDMRRSTSIHWHGFFQARTSGMDGPSFVSQCPIAPSASFDYVFDTAGQSGNYWYHSHLSTQYCDGLRGAFVVYDPDDPLKHLYDVDDGKSRSLPLNWLSNNCMTDNTIITLAEWYHVLAPAGQNSFFKTGIVPVQDSGLINGKGRYAGGELVPYAVITVKQGLRYRFRVFSLSCRPYMELSFDNHTFDVIELDGVEHDPTPFQRADIYAAQRISLVLHANQSVDNYWIRAPPTGGSPKNNPNFQPNLTLAILRYVGAPEVEPKTEYIPGAKFDDALMHPIASENPGNLGSGPPDHALTLNITNLLNPPFFDINGISYLSPSLPVLLQMLSGAGKPTDFLPSEQVFLLPPNSIIDITIPEGGVHGHNFDVVLGTNATVPNYINPPRRDVINISGGNTTFRFNSNNPGAWFLHCHIDWHLEAGLAVVFGELSTGNFSQTQIVQPDWKELCPTYDDFPPELQ